MKNLFLLLFALSFSFTPIANANAATTIASAYTRTSGPENVVAPFTLPAGTSTTRNYTGAVEVFVTGSGFSLGSLTNNAFGPFGTGFYSLGLGTSLEPLSGGRPDLTIGRFINFIDGVGAVPFGTTPAYNPANDYRFVVDLGSLSTPLSFGVLDGFYSDNGGSFNVTLWSLRAGANNGVPEPATWLMMLFGFALIGGSMRHRSRHKLLAA
jgi:PEP-CTERM motif